MKIYTKTGDQGETALFGGQRVKKDHLRICAYGGLDELNSWLGLVLCEAQLPQAVQAQLVRVQSELFQAGAELATPAGKKTTAKLLAEDAILQLEQEIDAMETALEPLRYFILPGGTREAASLHYARTVCRRVERDLVTLQEQEPQREVLLQYLNRLSDALFVSARFCNKVLNRADIPWIPEHRGPKS